MKINPEKGTDYFCLSRAETVLLAGEETRFYLSLEKTNDYHEFHQVHNTHRTQEFTMLWEPQKSFLQAGRNSAQFLEAETLLWSTVKPGKGILWMHHFTSSPVVVVGLFLVMQLSILQKYLCLQVTTTVSLVYNARFAGIIFVLWSVFYRNGKMLTSPGRSHKIKKKVQLVFLLMYLKMLETSLKHFSFNMFYC